MNIRVNGLILTTALLASSVIANAAENAVATVNGQPISQELYEMFLKQLQAKQPNAAGNRELLINELVTQELIYQDAMKKKLEKDEKVAFALEQIRRNTLIQANLSKVASAAPITDEMVKKEYDSKIKTASITEYNAQHIMLKTEEEAKAVIKELDGGALFSDVANAKSIDKASKGGNLGWFKAELMPKEFGDAVKSLDKGKYTKTPVKTQRGWHVIRVADTRKATPPKFEEVKDQIRKVLRNQQVQAYVASLHKNAKIEIMK